MPKTKAKKATSKKKVAKKTKSAVRRSGSHLAVKQTCAHPTTLFEVEFPTTILFWAGVALFFFIILLIAQSVI